MPITEIITGAIIDIAKKQLFSAEKKVAHDVVDSTTGKHVAKLICYRKQEGYNNVLLFVHGFSGASSATFGLTPDMLAKDPQFNGWDIFSIGYSSDIYPTIGKGIWSANPDIGKISLYLKTLLRNQFEDYNRLAFVAHSMGGLAVQRVILDLTEPDRNKISHLLLFGTPSAGLRKAFWFRFWNNQLSDLSYKSDFIKKLRADWDSAFQSGIHFSFKSIAGSKDEFVPVESSLTPFADKYQGVIEGNHITMIKPIDANDIHHQSFEIILKTLTNQQVAYLKGNPEEINLLLGEYHEVINKFLPKAKEIGSKELTQLVFALECTKRGDEAQKVLQEHPLAGKDSDILGIIGGRYKRRYLDGGLQSDLDKSFEYYLAALEIAKTNNKPKQIFYHAINLAFLFIVAQNNEGKMKEYAQLALDNCEPLTQDMWEMATLAESNLYLGNVALAEEFYRKAAIIAGTDIRAKQSSYSNAYYGYQSLTASKNKNAAFLKMLEEIYLT